MIFRGIGTSSIKIRVPERVRLFLNYSIPGFWKRTKQVFFDCYTYGLLKPYFQYRLGSRSYSLRYLFVLAPMRSGSSLLVHLLNSNPEIEGYGESHVSYNSHQDLEKLLYRTVVIQKSFDFKNAHYVMDKVVRNHDFSNNILLNEDVKFIFLLRDPAASFRSAAKLGQIHSELNQHQKFNNWFRYYQSRLGFLQNLATRINDPKRCLLVHYEDLLNRTDNSLQELQIFLSTSTAFSEKYKISQNTGRFRYGDPSDTLKQGKILRQTGVVSEKAVFKLEEKTQAYKAYQDCVDRLKEYAQTV